MCRPMGGPEYSGPPLRLFLYPLTAHISPTKKAGFRERVTALHNPAVAELSPEGPLLLPQLLDHRGDLCFLIVRYIDRLISFTHLLIHDE